MNIPADIRISTLIYMQIAVTNRYVNAFCPYPHFYYGACSAEVGKSRLKFSGSYFLWSYLLSRCQSNKTMQSVLFPQCWLEARLSSRLATHGIIIRCLRNDDTMQPNIRHEDPCFVHRVTSDNLYYIMACTQGLTIAK